MKHTITNLNERMQQIIEHSYTLLCNKVAGNNIDFDNEASFQHQLSIILNSVGKLYEYNEKDKFRIELEKEIILVQPTYKSPKDARCDIWLTLYNGKKKVEAAIELKFFKKTPGETITDNRFKIFCDLENLEHYKKQNKTLLCYSIICTNNKNYMNNQSSSYLNVGEGDKCEGGNITSNNREVCLTNNYTFHWDEYVSENGEEYFFLKLNF